MLDPELPPRLRRRSDVLSSTPGEDRSEAVNQRERVDAILSDVFEHEDRESILDRLSKLEELLVATIGDLANDVAALTAAVATLAAPTGTSIDAADQATLDSADAAVQAAEAAVKAFVTPPAAEEPVA